MVSVLTRQQRRQLHMENVRFDLFDPEDKGDASLWLRRFDIYTKAKGLNDEQIITTFPLYMKNAAILWFDSLAEETKGNLANLKKAFLSRYSPLSAGGWREIEEFISRKQQPHESVEEFAEAVNRLGSKVEKTDADKKEVIIRGLHPQIRQYVLTHEHDTLKKVMENALKAQSLIPPTDSQSLSSIERKINSLEEKLDVKLAALCNISENHHRSRSNQRSQSRSHSRENTSPRQRSRVTFNVHSNRPSSPGYTSQYPQHHQDEDYYQSRPYHRTTQYQRHQDIPRQQDYSVRHQDYQHQSRQQQHEDHRQPQPRRQQHRQFQQRTNFANSYGHSPQQRSTHSDFSNRTMCQGCGKYNHLRHSCPAMNKTCYNCHKLNHFASVCRSAKTNAFTQ